MVRHTLQTLRCEHRKFFLKYVWSFIKIMHEGFKLPKGVAYCMRTFTNRTKLLRNTLGGSRY